MPPKKGEHNCTVCSRSFARTEHLVRHRRTHTKEKPFSCHLCSQTFSRHDLLRRHHLKHHSLSQNGDSDLSVRCSTPYNQYEDVHINYSPNDVDSACTTNTTGLLNPGENAFDIEERPLINGRTDAWTAEAQSGLDIDTVPDGISNDFLSPGISDWLMNFSASDIDFGFNTAPYEEQPALGIPHSLDDRPSLLSRPTTPTQGNSMAPRSRAQATLVRDFSMSSECHQRLQTEISMICGLQLPTHSTLSRYIRRYFRSFNHHQPFLHEATWDVETAPTPLVLAVCANGAIYDLERGTAKQLNEGAVKAVEFGTNGTCALQTFMLCIAFAAWEGKTDSIALAAKLNVSMLRELRRQWAGVQDGGTGNLTWSDWIANQSLKRVTHCLFTLNNLMCVAYDLNPMFTLDSRHGLPARESEWHADCEEDWYESAAGSYGQHWPSFQSVEAQLSDESLSLPSNLGVLGCHVVMVAILNRIILLRRSISPTDPVFSRRQANLTALLKRWQRMWELEPEASLHPDNPQGPILFNSTALLRLAFVRLAADFTQIRGAFMFCETPKEIEPFVLSMSLPPRDQYTTRAALQAALALRIPVKLGIKVVSRTSFWIWSVQHALCYFECAIFLSKWLQKVHCALDLNAEESNVIKIVDDILQDIRGADQPATYPSRHSELLHNWANLLNTADTTVWHLIPKMAQILELYAREEAISS